MNTREPIFHIATRADWEAAKRSGVYTTSTRGRSLADEGFIHASRRRQVAGVFQRYYADAGEPLVLLRINPDRLQVEMRDEAVGDEMYPHIYGPIGYHAVVDVLPLNARGGTESMTSLFVKEMALRIGLAVFAMLCAGIGAEVARQRFGGNGSQGTGALVGLAVGALLAVLAYRAIRRRH